MSVIREFFKERVTVYIAFMVLVGLSVATGCAKSPLSLNSSHVKAAGVGSVSGMIAQSQTGRDADSQTFSRSGQVAGKDGDSQTFSRSGQVARGIEEETLTEGETTSPFAFSGTNPILGTQVAGNDLRSDGSGDFAPKKGGDLRIAKMLPFQTTSELGDVHFQFDRHDMNEASKLILQENARWLKQHPGVKIEIQGHADDRGTNNYNLGLGERRAQIVKKYLTALGIADDRLFAVSYGEEKPFCFKNNENCWWQNRRGHFMVSGPQAGKDEIVGMLR